MARTIRKDGVRMLSVEQEDLNRHADTAVYQEILYTIWEHETMPDTLVIKPELCKDLTHRRTDPCTVLAIHSKSNDVGSGIWMFLTHGLEKG